MKMLLLLAVVLLSGCGGSASHSVQSEAPATTCVNGQCKLKGN